ncbi:MAG: nucleotide sugar dehydrogenase [bacterium]|nr:nucleotide sugar dehydrogenase [Betaproteobacteria bacterium]
MSPATQRRPAVRDCTVAVVGLGYVGLPLALAFGREMDTLGFDISERRVADCSRGVDHTGEATAADYAAASRARYTTDPSALRAADFIVVAVPTPVDGAHQPDFGPLRGACRSAGAHLKPGATIVFESTVYPGATEEVCIPLLEQVSGGRWKQDFFVGYSPERINPGDREHTLSRIVKVVAGDTPDTLDAVAALYEVVVRAGVHRAPSIAVAEAAKVIENTQRDLNIALMNELSLIFHRLGLDTQDVLAAAATKWNFLPFRPGLVGGHCIGVDPYYLTHKAETVGYHPEVILAGRRINDGMGAWVAAQTVKQLIAAGSAVRGAKVNVLGLTFKEDVPDLRNSKVIDVIRELQSFGVEVHCHDPVASAAEAAHEYGVVLHAWEDLPRAEALVVAVSHRAFLQGPVERYRALLVEGGAFVDVKAAFDRAALAAAGWRVWRL